MTALNFPDTPAVGDLYGSTGTVWRWDGARWASTSGASGARGVVGYAQVIANQSTTGVETALTGLSVSPTLVAGRTYKITTQILYNAGFSEQRALLRIRANGTQLQLAEADATTAPNAALACQVVYAAAASGAVTFASSLGPVAGGAALLMVASSVQPAFILVEDITYEAGSGGGGGGGSVGTGLEAAKPTAPNPGSRYFATDTKRDWLHDGTGWIIMAEPEQSYVTAFAGTAQGNGTLTGRYQRSNGWVEFTATFELGSTSGVSGGGWATMPFPAKRAMWDAIKVAYSDAGNLVYAGMTYITAPGENRCNLYVIVTDALFGKIGVYGPTVPFAWGVGDIMHVSGRYQMQTLYT